MKQAVFLDGVRPNREPRACRVLLPKPRKTGHAATPGTGPFGETCLTCRHRVRVPYHDKFWSKCKLMEANWTHGPGTDIKAGSPACRLWEPKNE